MKEELELVYKSRNEYMVELKELKNKKKGIFG